MKTIEEQGGCAFACASDGGHQAGMTLRDWFATNADEKTIERMLPTSCGDTADLLYKLGIIKDKPKDQEKNNSYNNYDVVKLRCWARYKYADAMLEERNK